MIHLPLCPTCLCLAVMALDEDTTVHLECPTCHDVLTPQHPPVHFVTRRVAADL